ncbi:hypothetical protein N788_00745 [Arenimonas donghaensis DSM 18148 = HO3-R19]|uniref:DUF1615 domain-containing protein n=1 Tax=Arenimonas donghaensis DSM 18148 = HO3-R19 TaxID=1121014 RepID=A0A087MLH7_9GAMM|nr:hypothetical protein N788_00745 [Arenimonas donghaensis DSM 18148 = HO3-R19]
MIALGLLAGLLGACATAPRGPSVDQMRADVARRIPGNVSDRQGWATDIAVAMHAQGIVANPENICSVLAVLEQESGYVADPVVPNLARVSRGELERRARAKRIPLFALNTALKLPSSDGRSYAERLAVVRTERELSEVYEDLVGRVPLGKRLFENWNPVQTGGPMQVSIPFAEKNDRGYPYEVQGSIRNEVFTRRGGMYFGIAHLLGYQTPYVRKVHRFADYNAGWYASRNAAFQAAVAVATGRDLALDGDLLDPGAPLDRPGETERAVRELAPRLGLDERGIRRALAQGDELAFNDSVLFKQVFALAEARAGKALPRERIPGIRLESPKITRELTTAWFANRVYDRYRRCLAR